ncbi:hypothetical protein Tco_0261879 [Tanacetum coccineum]
MAFHPLVSPMSMAFQPLNNSESKSDAGDDFNDGSEVAGQSHSQGVMEFINALEATNPNTIVKWFHDPQSSPNVITFKFIFWAFGPAINAFRLCPPIICVDNAHLKGCYRGKLLVAVTKDANNNILLIAYAIVDEETAHSQARN